jgi:hypothetical protein
MGFLDIIKSKLWFEPVFVYSEQYSITAKYMKDKLMSVLDKLETNNNQEKRSKEFAVKCIDSLDGKFNVIGLVSENKFKYVSDN